MLHRRPTDFYLQLQLCPAIHLPYLHCASCSRFIWKTCKKPKHRTFQFGWRFFPFSCEQNVCFSGLALACWLYIKLGIWHKNLCWRHCKNVCIALLRIEKEKKVTKNMVKLVCFRLLASEIYVPQICGFIFWPHLSRLFTLFRITVCMARIWNCKITIHRLLKLGNLVVNSLYILKFIY